MTVLSHIMNFLGCGNALSNWLLEALISAEILVYIYSLHRISDLDSSDWPSGIILCNSLCRYMFLHLYLLDPYVVIHTYWIHMSRFGRGCSRLFSKLMASDDVPVCSRRSWPWRAGSRAGSLRPVVLVAFTNVIPTARRASRLSDRWLLSRLWATTCHSERRRNNNYNINLL